MSRDTCVFQTGERSNSYILCILYRSQAYYRATRGVSTAPAIGIRIPTATLTSKLCHRQTSKPWHQRRKDHAYSTEFSLKLSLKLEWRFDKKVVVGTYHKPEFSIAGYYAYTRNARESICALSSPMHSPCSGTLGAYHGTKYICNTHRWSKYRADEEVCQE